MLYANHLTVTKATDVDNPVRGVIYVKPGRLVQVDVVVPTGCADLVRLQIWRAGIPILPATPDMFIAGNGSHHRFPYDYVVRDKPLWFDLVAYNLSTNQDHKLWIGLSVLPLRNGLLDGLASVVGGLRKS